MPHSLALTEPVRLFFKWILLVACTTFTRQQNGAAGCSKYAPSVGGATSVGLQLAITKLRPVLEPLVLNNSRTWENIVPALDLLEDLGEIQAAKEDPEMFMKKILALLDAITEAEERSCVLRWEKRMQRWNTWIGPSALAGLAPCAK